MPVQNVVARAPIKHIVFTAAIDEVVAAQAVHAVGVVTQTSDVVIVRCPVLHQLCHDIGNTPLGSVCKIDDFNSVCASIKITLDRHLVCAPGQCQVITTAAHQRVSRRQACPQLQRVQVATGVVIVADRVCPITLVKEVGVVAVAAVERVIAFPAVKRVGLCTTVQHIITG